MFALQGYYDGQTIQPLEEIRAEKNQKLIITILDEFIDETEKIIGKKSARGSLAKYADSAKQELEKSAWENAVVKKYGNA